MTRGMKKAAIRMMIYGAITSIFFAVGASRASAGLMMIIPIVSIYLYVLNWDSFEKLADKHKEKRSRYCPLMKED